MIIENQKNFIFKYGSINYLEKTLQNRTLKFSFLEEYNDIHETEFKIVHYFQNENDRQFLERFNKPLTSELIELSNTILKKYQVTCFSRKWDNNLMWSHYADNSKGICYCFEFTGYEESLFEKQTGWGNVIYSSTVPAINIFQEVTTQNMLEVQLHDVILTKSTDWSYEEEVRFFSKNTLNQAFIANSLKAIIIGRKVDDTNIKHIENIVEQFNLTNNTNLEILYANRIANSYTLKLEENKNSRLSSNSCKSWVSPILSTTNSKLVSTRNN